MGQGHGLQCRGAMDKKRREVEMAIWRMSEVLVVAVGIKRVIVCYECVSGKQTL